METWREIDTFPGYSVSKLGQVRSDETGRILAMQKNQQDIIYVVLFRDGKKYNRSVAPLVAEAFVEVPFNNTTYNTIIYLDGDRTNLQETNLAWRQRWFAIMYHKQFESDWRGFKVPVENLDTGEIFQNSWEASIHYGLLEKKLVVAICNEEEVWPTRHRYRVA